MAFEHQHTAVLTGERGRRQRTVGANGLPPRQPEEFPVVRCEHRQTAAPGLQHIYMLGHGVYAVGVQHEGGDGPGNETAGAHIAGAAAPHCTALA